LASGVHQLDILPVKRSIPVKSSTVSEPIHSSSFHTETRWDVVWSGDMTGQVRRICLQRAGEQVKVISC
jgi:hypothetical protein